MANSFAYHYYLCRVCLEWCNEVGAIEEWREESKKPRRYERVTVLAKTYAWLMAMKKQGRLRK
jgi:hypothetical protein